MAARQIVNILDVIYTPAAGSTRAIASEEMAKRVLQAWHDNIRPLQVNGLQEVSVSYVDLHSLTGTVGSVTAGTGTALWPVSGVKGVSPLPTNAAALINKSTSAGRGSKAGRLFFTGLPEGDSGDSANTLTAAAVSAYSSGFAALRTAINTYTSAVIVSATLQVVHTSALTPGVGTSTPVSSMSAEAELSTQSRRIRRR